MLDSLLDARRLLIRQVKEWSEILIGYEARNRYEVQDETGRLVARVAEEDAGLGRWLGRQFLGSCRRATLHVLDTGGGEIARIRKEWRGVLAEAFTDADLFGIEYTMPSLPAAVKKLLFAATFLIDFTHFENNQRRGVDIGIDLGG